MIARSKKHILTSFALTALLATACTFTKIAKERYSLPSFPVSSDDSQTSLMLALSGPMKGSVLSQTVSVPNGEGGYSLDVHTGGLAGLGAHLAILKDKFKNNLVTLDSGHFSSPNLSKADLERVISFYKEANYSAILLSASDFDAISKYRLWSQARELPFVNANWVNVRTKDSALGNDLKPYRIIKKNNLSIAIIGLTLNEGDRPDPKIAPEIIREESVAAYLRVMAELRSQKVDYKILIINEGTKCESNIDGDPKCLNENKDRLLTFLKRLPPDSLDLVATGGGHFFQQELEKVAILQNKSGGNSLSLREFSTVSDSNKLTGRDLPPVMLCHQFFQVTNDCYFEENFKGKDERTRLLQESRFEKVPAKFLGFEVKLDPKWQL